MRVLIVEDHIELADILYESLVQYVVPRLDVVGVANDGIQAVEMITDKEPDIVLLDLIMPKLDGLGVIREINQLKLRNKPRFIVLSALGNGSTVKQALSLGAERYIIKPFQIDTIVSLFEQMHMPG